jgi:hypothetical protein
VKDRVIIINMLRSVFISYWYNKLNINEKDILIVCMRTSKREAESNYRKDYTDTDTLAKYRKHRQTNRYRQYGYTNDRYR